jgi:hypothetical protein
MRKRCLPILLLSLLLLLLPGNTLATDGGSAIRPALREAQSGDPPMDDCDVQLSSSRWVTASVDVSKTFIDMRDNSLALDAAGNPHVAYGGDHLYYAYHDGASWHIETVDAGLQVGAYASLELDAAGRPHIAYYDQAGDDLKYAYHDGTSWQIHTVDTDDGMC